SHIGCLISTGSKRVERSRRLHSAGVVFCILTNHDDDDATKWYQRVPTKPLLASPDGPPLRWGVPEKFATRGNFTARRLVTPRRAQQSRNFSSPVPSVLFSYNRFARLRAQLPVIAFLSAAMVCVAGLEAFAQASAQTPVQTPAQSPVENAAATRITAVTAPADAARVVQFLDQTIAWYQQFGVQEQLVSSANDDVYVSADRQMANEVVRLAFQYARAQAESARPAAVSPQPAPQLGAEPSTYQALMRQEVEAQKDENQVVSEVGDLQKKIATASRKQKQALEAQLAETQAEVDLAKARVDAIQDMTRFLSGASTGAAGLSAQIDALESTLPPNLRDATRGGSANENVSGGTSVSPQQQATRGTSTAAITNAAGSGLWERASNLFGIWGKLRSISAALQQTQELARSAQDIRNPLVTDLRELTQRGDQLAHQADVANTSTLEQEKQQLDVVTRQFKQLTGS